MENTEKPVEIENTSGKGKFAEVPKELSGWNWGAFFLTWIWGLANGSPIALLVFVPLAGLFAPFYLGAVGNQLAWQNKYWHDVKDFKTTQKKWAVAGIIVTVIVIAVFSFNLTADILKQNENKKMAEQVYNMVLSDSEAMVLIGENPKMATSIGSNSVSVGGEIVSSGYDIVISSNNGMFTVRATLNEDQITSIEIEKWNTNTEQPENYIFYP